MIEYIIEKAVKLISVLLLSKNQAIFSIVIDALVPAVSDNPVMFVTNASTNDGVDVICVIAWITIGTPAITKVVLAPGIGEPLT
ncbi:hypothetical protein VK90_00735 [Bacillus sp. LK2]|nr:hypothetical protein VK90_00735 [Bacillus sp. LK2]